MNINTLFPSKYMKAHDLEGKSWTLTIRDARVEELGQFAEKEKCLVLYFVGAKKGLVTNRTNAMTIAALYSPETSNWIGKAITLYPTKVQAFGKVNDAIRVKPQVPPPPTTKQEVAVPEAANEEYHEEEEVEVTHGTSDETSNGTSELPSGTSDRTSEPPANPFDDPTPYFQRTFLRQTGHAYDSIQWLAGLHKKGEGGPCSKAEYKKLAELLGVYCGKETGYLLSVLCQHQISEDERPAVAVANALTRYLAPTRSDARGVQIPNPELNPRLIEAVTAIMKVEEAV